MADIDTEILKTLESIEDLLKGASVLAKGKSLSPSQQKSQQSQKQRADKEVTKGFKAIAAQSGELKDTLLGLNKSLNGLSAEVGRTETGFGSLNAQLNRFAESLQIDVPQPVDQPQATVSFTGLQAQLDATSAKLANFGTSITAVQAKLDSVNVTGVNSGLTSLQGQLNGINTGNLAHALGAAATPVAAFAGGLAAAAAAMPQNNQVAANLTQQLQNLAGTTNGTNRALQQFTPPWQMVLGRMLNRFGNVTIGAGTAGIALNAFAEVIKKLTVDFFSLARAGLGSYSNLYELSKNAIKAGMSLKEYTAMLRENISFAARAGSLENFDKITSAADKQLAGMGIFGDEARNLQAKLANTNTMMGVSQDQLSGRISSQISVFDQLRKSTMMTADEFADLVKNMSKQEEVQKELVGLNGSDRLARQQQLIQIQTTGQRLGLAAEESAKLADALMKQRGETVKNRFEQAGRIRQMAAFAGMGAQGERAAQIVMKGRNASADELEELRKIAGNLDSTTQSIYENGSFGAQNVVDVLGETLNGKAFGQLMQANRPANLAEQSGAVNQKAFGQHVDKFGQAVGQLLAWTRGFSESVLPALLTGIGATLLTVFRGPISRVLAGAIGRLTGVGAGATAAAAGAAPAAIGQTATMLKGALQWFLQIPTKLRQGWNAVMLTNAISGPIQTMKLIFQDLASKAGGFIKNMGTSIANGARGVFGSITGGLQSAGAVIKSGGEVVLGGLRTLARGFAPAAMLIDGVIEAFTGDIAEALNPSGGFFNRIGGIITSALSAVPNFIIDAIGFVFGEAFGTKLQNAFDILVVTLNAGVRVMLKGIVDMASWLTKWLPDDSKLKQTLAGWSEGLAKSTDENFAALKTLNEDGGSTLKKISDKNKKSAEDASKNNEAATQKAVASQAKFNNVQLGTAISNAQMIQDAKTLVGTPQVQQPATVAPGTVNTPETAAQATGASKEKAPETSSNTEMISLLQSILKVLTDSLTEEQKQAALAEQLLSRSRPTASFVPAEVTANRLLKQGLV